MRSAMETMEIILEDLRFFAHHGVGEQERICGNEFSVDLSVEYHVDLSTCQLKEERLEDTISYADLYSIVAEEMCHTQLLLETVATAIVCRIKNQYPKITKGSLKITKNIPPIGNLDGRAAVKLRF